MKHIYVLTIFDKQTSESKDFHKGFMFPTKTLVALTIEDLKKQFRVHITSSKKWPTPEEHIVNEIVEGIKTRNPNIYAAHITIYSESEIVI